MLSPSQGEQMPTGQTCGGCGAGGHNRRTCPDEIQRLMTAVDSSFDRVEDLFIQRPRHAAQKLRDHMTQLVDDRDEALTVAENAERELAGAQELLSAAQTRVT